MCCLFAIKADMGNDRLKFSENQLPLLGFLYFLKRRGHILTLLFEIATSKCFCSMQAPNYLSKLLQIHHSSRETKFSKEYRLVKKLSRKNFVEEYSLSWGHFYGTALEKCNMYWKVKKKLLKTFL